MYKLIAMDLDGTLLDDDKKVPKENLEVLEQLISKGYEVVIATGRRYWSAKQLLKDVRKPLVILANNGNIVRSTADDGIIIKKYLDIKDFKTLIKEGKKRGLQPVVHVDGFEEGIDLIIELDKGNNNYISKGEKRYREVESYLEMDEDRILAVVYAGNREELVNFHLDISKRYPNRYSSHVMENIVIAEALLEVMNPLGNKWLSLSEYAKEKGVAEEEIIAIGDDNNDIQMIKNAGCGIAMKNAIKEAKKVADIITEKDNNQAGVAFELRKILKL